MNNTSFVVYHVATTLMDKVYRLEHHARARVEKLNRMNPNQDRGYYYATLEHYQNSVVKMKTVRNLMTGQEVQIPSNTPLSCDPSSETYWSM